MRHSRHSANGLSLVSLIERVAESDLLVCDGLESGARESVSSSIAQSSKVEGLVRDLLAASSSLPSVARENEPCLDILTVMMVLYLDSKLILEHIGRRGLLWIAVDG